MKMDYELLKEAFTLAKLSHNFQKDKSGEDYIFHPIMVALQCDSTKAKVVALLHDVVEDTDTTIEEIYDKFGQEIGDAVKLLTHPKGMDYLEYVEEVKKNDLAREVKIADLTHNSDLSRLREIGEKDRRRAEKYQKVLEILNSANQENKKRYFSDISHSQVYRCNEDWSQPEKFNPYTKQWVDGYRRIMQMYVGMCDYEDIDEKFAQKIIQDRIEAIERGEE